MDKAAPAIPRRGNPATPKMNSTSRSAPRSSTTRVTMSGVFVSPRPRKKPTRERFRSPGRLPSSSIRRYRTVGTTSAGLGALSCTMSGAPRPARIRNSQARRLTYIPCQVKAPQSARRCAPMDWATQICTPMPLQLHDRSSGHSKAPASPAAPCSTVPKCPRKADSTAVMMVCDSMLKTSGKARDTTSR